MELIDAELKEEFYQEFLDLCNDVEEFLLKLEKEPSNPYYIREIFRPFHTIKGNAGLINEPEIKEISQLAESVLDEIRQERQQVSQIILDVCLRSVDLIKNIAEKRSASFFSEKIKGIKKELQAILDSFISETNINEKRVIKPDTNNGSKTNDQWQSIIKSIHQLDRNITEMKEKEQMAHYLPGIFDAVFNLNYDLKRYHGNAILHYILKYLEIFCTCLFVEDKNTFRIENWEMLNNLKNDLQFQIFPLIVEEMNVNIVYYNEQDSLGQLIKQMDKSLNDQFHYVFINLNIHHELLAIEIDTLSKIIQNYPKRVHLIQRYIEEKDSAESSFLKKKAEIKINNSFWQALYEIIA